MTSKIFFFFIFSAVLSLAAAPAPFKISDQLARKAPVALRKQLQKSTVGSQAYTDTAMKILEDRIRKTMQLRNFSLNYQEAVKGMSLKNHRVSEFQLRFTGKDREKLFRQGEKMRTLLSRYNESFLLRKEIIKLFKECTPVLPENRFHSIFFSLLEFQHIYREYQLLEFQKNNR